MRFVSPSREKPRIYSSASNQRMAAGEKKSRSGIVGAEPTTRVQQSQKFLSNGEVAPEGGPARGNSAPNSGCCSLKIEIQLINMHMQAGERTLAMLSLSSCYPFYWMMQPGRFYVEFVIVFGKSVALSRLKPSAALGPRHRPAPASSHTDGSTAARP